jgi:hypothetical protein
MGKTSLLQYVCDPAIIESRGLSRDEYLFIYLDCPTMGSFAPAQFWQKMLTLLLDEARGTSLISLMETIRGILAKETIHQTDFEIVLDEIHRTGRALALLLDEFEWVVDPRDEYTTRVFLSGLRALTTRRPRVVSLVVATREELKKLCEPIKFPTSPFYNNFLFRRLKPFTKKEIKQLFEKTLEGTGIEFGPEEHECIRTLGGTHPHLIQLAGALIFDARAQGLKVADCLERINSEFEEQTRYHFDEVWEDSSLQERMLLILFALCGLARQEKERTYDVETLEHILSRDERALTFLAERGLITEARPTATLSPPMFEPWVLREIRSCDEREFVEYASLMFDLLAKGEAECAVEAMRLVSGRKRKCLTQERRIDMGLPADQQLALTVLAQATQFLFDELGRRLDFWRKKKGEQAIPESVEPVSRPDGAAVKLDNLERQIDVQRLLLKQEDIETSMDIIRKKKRMVNALRTKLADPLTSDIEKARIEAGIKEREEEIERESNKLEALLKEVYGENPDSS